MVVDSGLLKKIDECCGKCKNPGRGYCELITFCDGNICKYQSQKSLQVRHENKWGRYLTVHSLCKFNESLSFLPAIL